MWRKSLLINKLAEKKCPVETSRMTSARSVKNQAHAGLFAKKIKNAALKKLCEENRIPFVKLGEFHKIRWSAWRHETLSMLSVKHA